MKAKALPPLAEIFFSTQSSGFSQNVVRQHAVPVDKAGLIARANAYPAHTAPDLARSGFCGICPQNRIGNDKRTPLILPFKYAIFTFLTV